MVVMVKMVKMVVMEGMVVMEVEIRMVEMEVLGKFILFFFFLILIICIFFNVISFNYSGNGGDGGRGGQGGRGGDGGNGATVVIKVEDPLILSIIEVDVTGGKGGVNGADGQPGYGGSGGSGGFGGAAGHWTETFTRYRGDGTTYTETLEYSSNPGISGRSGKDGKTPPSSQGKSNSQGRIGLHGKVSFCVTVESKIARSVGTPYRPAIKQSDVPTLIPKPKNFFCEGTQADPFVYGQELIFGPILPVNCGGLACPPSKIVFLTIVKEGRNTESKFYPVIPAPVDTRYGCIANEFQHSLTMNVPSLSMSKNILTYDMKWPWDFEYSRDLKIQGSFWYVLTVDDVSFAPTEKDVDISSKELKISVDVPIEIKTRFYQKKDSLQAPQSLAIGENEIATVTFQLRNKLNIGTIPRGYGRFLLRFASTKLPMEYVDISPKFSIQCDNINTKITDPKIRTVSGDTPELKPLASATVETKLTLPKIFAMDLFDYSTAGTLISYRPELWCDNVLAQYGNTLQTRISPPRPPVSNILSTDILIFSHFQFANADYILLSNLFSKLGCRTYFLDYDHFCNNSKVASTTEGISLEFWRAQKGIATIIWMPPENNSNLLSSSQIQDHLSEGGKIILGSKSTYTYTTTKDTVPYPLHGRSCVFTSERASIYNFQGDHVSDNSILGQNMTILLVNALAVMSPVDLLTILWGKRMLLNTMVNDIQLKKYQKVPDAGCCGCYWLCGIQSTKIVPELSAACTIHDCILSTLRTHLTLDLENFQVSQSKEHCYCIQDIIKFVTDHVLEKETTEQIAYFARDIDALYHACSLETHKFKNSKKEFVNNWNNFKEMFVPIFEKCREITEGYFVDDTIILGERIKDICVISGFSVRKKGFFKKQESLNVGEGSQYSFSVQSISSKK